MRTEDPLHLTCSAILSLGTRNVRLSATDAEQLRYLFEHQVIEIQILMNGRSSLLSFRSGFLL